MKKFFIIALMVFVACGLVFATTWSTLNIVDDFGDDTGMVRLYTIIEDVKYGSYSWEYEDCAILIDKGYDDSILPYIVQIYLGDTSYSNWIVSTKLNDGIVNTYYFEKYGKYIGPSMDDAVSFVLACNGLIADFKAGCKVILYPDNKYSTDKYNLGYISIYSWELVKVN